MAGGGRSILMLLSFPAKITEANWQNCPLSKKRSFCVTKYPPVERNRKYVTQKNNQIKIHDRSLQARSASLKQTSFFTLMSFLFVSQHFDQCMSLVREGEHDNTGEKWGREGEDKTQGGRCHNVKQIRIAEEKPCPNMIVKLERPKTRINGLF